MSAKPAEIPTKPIEQSFADWEGSALGFGYGSGEPHTMLALKMFFECCAGPQGTYDYQDLEKALTPPVAWLMISMLCKSDIIEYGTSPRFAWLTPHGRRLRDFVASKTADELAHIVCSRTCEDEPGVCYPDTCNCGPNGYVAGRKCPNPFWPDNRGRIR